MTDRELKAAATGIIIYEYIIQTGEAPEFPDGTIGEAACYLNDEVLEITLQLCASIDPGMTELEYVDDEDDEE